MKKSLISAIVSAISLTAALGACKVEQSQVRNQSHVASADSAIAIYTNLANDRCGACHDEISTDISTWQSAGKSFHEMCLASGTAKEKIDCVTNKAKHTADLAADADKAERIAGLRNLGFYAAWISTPAFEKLWNEAHGAGSSDSDEFKKYREKYTMPKLKNKPVKFDDAHQMNDTAFQDLEKWMLAGMPNLAEAQAAVDGAGGGAGASGASGEGSGGAGGGTSATPTSNE